jgi:hypothetical protein
MKTKTLRLVGVMTLMAVLAMSPAALALNSADATKSLAGSTVLELPAKAADLIAKAPTADKKNVTMAVVKAAIDLRPSATLAIVSAVARKNPAAAPVAAVTAVTLQHRFLVQVTKAAALAAPSQAGNIVAALIKEFPQDYGTIAIAAAEGAPSAGREILAVVADYVPGLQASINGITANFAANDGNIPVRAVLTQSYNQALTSGAAASSGTPASLPSQNYNQTLIPLDPLASAKGHATLAQNTAISPTTPATPGAPTLGPATIGPPYTPITGPVNNYGPGQLTPQQPGGRSYSSP